MGLSRFAGLWITNVPTTVNLTTVPTKLGAWVNSGDGPGADADLTVDGIYCKVPGNYYAICTLSFDVDAGRTVYAEFRVNGATGSHFRGSVEGIASGGRVNLSLLGAAALNEDDVVTVYVYSDLAATMTLVDGQFGILSI